MVRACGRGRMGKSIPGLEDKGLRARAEKGVKTDVVGYETRSFRMIRSLGSIRGEVPPAGSFQEHLRRVLMRPGDLT